MKEKHLWKVASVLIAMLMGLAMVGSCSKDDDEGGGKYPPGAEVCFYCHGSLKCAMCNGTGQSSLSSFCVLCAGTGVCSVCDGKGYYFPDNGGSGSGSNSSGGSYNGSSSGSGSNNSTRTCAVCGGSGKCTSPSNDKYHCRGTGKCQTCSGKGYYWYGGLELMCPNCDVPGHGNTPGNGKCGFCGGSGQCKYCNGKGHK